jgi:hypothetical protein
MKGLRFSNLEIKHLKRNQIDEDKWNDCISKSGTQLFYPLTTYLDVVSNGWEAIVYEDYIAVMPLPVKRSGGIAFIVQPPFCQQLGVFSRTQISNDIFREMVACVQHYTGVLYTFNHSNQTLLSKTGMVNCKNKTNLILDISQNYESVYLRYNSNTKRNIRKAESLGLTYKPVEALDVIELKHKNLPSGVSWKLLPVFVSLIKNNGHYIDIHNFGVFYNNELIAGCVFLQYQHRIVYLLAVATEQGKQMGAMFFLVNEFIKTVAGKGFLLDFEGSDISGVSAFFKGFGACEESIPVFQKGTLWPYKFLTKILG